MAANTVNTQEVPYLCHALWSWQYHLIARLDDMVKLKLVDIKPNNQHPFALSIQMVWSKISWRSVMLLTKLF